MHHILPGNSVEMNVKKASRDGPIRELIVEARNLLGTSCTDVDNVLPVDRDDRVQQNTG